MSRPKEIGGYLELERLSGSFYHENIGISAHRTAVVSESLRGLSARRASRRSTWSRGGFGLSRRGTWRCSPQQTTLLTQRLYALRAQSRPRPSELRWRAFVESVSSGLRVDITWFGGQA